MEETALIVMALAYGIYFLFMFFIINCFSYHIFPLFKLGEKSKKDVEDTKKDTKKDDSRTYYTIKELEKLYPKLDISKVQITIGTSFYFDGVKLCKDTDKNSKIETMRTFCFDCGNEDNTFDLINSHSVVVIDSSKYIDTYKHIKCYLKK